MSHHNLTQYYPRTFPPYTDTSRPSFETTKMEERPESDVLYKQNDWLINGIEWLTSCIARRGSANVFYVRFPFHFS